MNTLFTECYGDQKVEGNNQNGCGFTSGLEAVALAPLMAEIKKGILNASSAVIRQLRKRQVGGSVRKKKTKKKPAQAGRGKIKKKQVGKGRKKSAKKKN